MMALVPSEIYLDGLNFIIKLNQGSKIVWRAQLYLHPGNRRFWKIKFYTFSFMSEIHELSPFAINSIWVFSHFGNKKIKYPDASFKLFWNFSIQSYLISKKKISLPVQMWMWFCLYISLVRQMFGFSVKVTSLKYHRSLLITKGTLSSGS